MKMNKGVKRNEKIDKFEAVRRKLIAMQQDIIKGVKSEVVQILKEEDKYNGVSDDGDFADVAFRDAMQASIFNRHRSQLREIEEALRKISEGTYGICDDCEEEIPVGRLNVMPFALRCVDCQEKHEILRSEGSEGEETAALPHADAEESNG
jgi:DnaK suppressor protein